MNAIDAALLKANEAGDGAALVALYQQAARNTQNADQKAFYLTHAYVFALEAGHDDAEALRAQLVEAGRESPLQPPLPPNR